MEKLERLIDSLKSMGSALIAYSGGADSALLLKAAGLSGIKALAVTAKSPTTPMGEAEDAASLARELGVEHRVVETDELSDENFASNPPERCFYCKDIRYGMLRKIMSEESMGFLIDGSNLDDTRDFRPGMKAAMKHGVRSPLVECGFGKDEIRAASRELGLKTWDKPSSACLATRIPYGVRIEEETLGRIDRAEGFLKSLGFGELRVRDHGGIARIEVPAKDIPLMVGIREDLIMEMRGLGFKFVSLDLEGLRSGGMNRLIE